MLIAVPMLLVFGALLTSADAVFEKMITDLFNWDVYEIFTHMFWIAFWAWVVAGFLRMTFVWKEHAAQPSTHKGVLGTVEISMVLGSLIALFLGFVIVQARYLFGGADVLRSMIKLSYAEYARRGFFELVTVAALVLPFLLFMHWLLKKDDARLERLFRLLSGGVIALLFVIMFSALYRMRLYQIEFGLTELRLYTTAFMGWLAIVFVWFMLTVRARQNRSVCVWRAGVGLCRAAPLERAQSRRFHRAHQRGPRGGGQSLRRELRGGPQRRCRARADRLTADDERERSMRHGRPHSRSLDAP